MLCLNYISWTEIVSRRVRPGLLSWILLKCQFANKFPFVSGEKWKILRLVNKTF